MVTPPRVTDRRTNGNCDITKRSPNTNLPVPLLISMENGLIPVIISRPRESTSFSSVMAEVKMEIPIKEINSKLISPMVIKKSRPTALLKLMLLAEKNSKREKSIIPNIARR